MVQAACKMAAVESGHEGGHGTGGMILQVGHIGQHTLFAQLAHQRLQQGCAVAIGAELCLEVGHVERDVAGPCGL